MGIEFNPLHLSPPPREFIAEPTEAVIMEVAHELFKGKNADIADEIAIILEESRKNPKIHSRSIDAARELIRGHIQRWLWEVLVDREIVLCLRRLCFSEREVENIMHEIYPKVYPPSVRPSELPYNS